MCLALEMLIVVILPLLVAAVSATSANNQIPLLSGAKPEITSAGIDVSPFVFTSLQGLLRQWQNVFAPTGHTIIPGKVPAHTLLYHARRDMETPPSPEWFAFDIEMSYGIIAPFGVCIMNTYAATRPLNVLYFDGMSAALGTNGTLDSQNIFLYGKVVDDDWGHHRPDRPGHEPQRNPLEGEYKRARELCEWANRLGEGVVEGFVRMNTGFELLWCDFNSRSIELVSRLNVTVPDADSDNNTSLLEGSFDHTPSSHDGCPPPNCDCTRPDCHQPPPHDHPPCEGHPPSVGDHMPCKGHRPPRNVHPPPKDGHLPPKEHYPPPKNGYLPPDEDHPPPGNDLPPQNGDHLSPDSDHLPPSGSYPHFPYPRGPRQRSPFSIDSRWEWARSATWHYNLAPEARVVLDYCRMTSYYNVSIPGRTPPGVQNAKRQHRLKEITPAQAKKIKKQVEYNLLHDDFYCSGIDWRETADGITRRYFGRIMELKGLLAKAEHLLEPCGNKTELAKVTKRIRGLTHAMAMPFFQLSDEGNEAAELRCVKDYTGRVDLARVQNSEKLLVNTVESVMKNVCKIVFTAYSDFSNLEDTASVVRKWTGRVERLVGWVDWAGWHRCNDACGWDEVCAIPLWPILGTPWKPGQDEDLLLNPRCIGIGFMESGNGGWGPGRPPEQ